MHRDDLVAVGIAQIREIDLARDTLAPAGRVLDALAAVGDAGVVERLDLLGAGAGEADGAAIGMRRRLAVDRPGDAERTGLRAIPNAALGIGLARRMTDRAQHGVVELLGRFDIVGADHYVREHGCCPPARIRWDFAWTSAAPRSSTVPWFTSIRQQGGELETATTCKRARYGSSPLPGIRPSRP